jgi:hypothetical protein
MSQVNQKAQGRSTSPIPGQLNRTLSSSIRQYRQESVGKGRRVDGNSSRSYGTLRQSRNSRSSLHEETQSLLGTENVEDGDDEPNEDEHELEAQHSDQADSDGLYPPRCTWTSNVVRPKRADPFGNSDCAIWDRIHL